MRTETQKINEFDAYCAFPDKGATRGAVIVIQEILGVNDNIKSLCHWLAGEGYIAIAPDMFWRLERNIALAGVNEEEWQKAFELMNRFDLDVGIDDIQAAINYARNLEGGHGRTPQKVATMGFCLGGRCAYYAACRTDGDAHISYYGVGIESAIEEATQIKAPTILHLACDDQFVPPAAQAAIHKGLAHNPHIDIYDYSGCDHAFARAGGDSYDEPAASAAHKRTLDLLSKTLSI